MAKIEPAPSLASERGPGRVKVRKPPYEAVLKLHEPVERGKCRWCGKPTDERTPQTKQLRSWHKACETEYMIIVRTEVARHAVLARDGGICLDCGQDWSERYCFRKGADVIQGLPWDDERRLRGPAKELYRAERAMGFYRYTEVIWVSLWHVDHKIPLWKVRHMPPLKRIEYFKLANLVTRCDPCHKVKSRKETMERTKINKREKVEKPKRKWGSRKMGARPPANVKQLQDL